MCRVSVPVRRNLVVHFRVAPLARLSPSQVRAVAAPPGSRWCGNFYVAAAAAGGASYTVFPASGHVIATGLGGEEEDARRAVVRALEDFAALVPNPAGRHAERLRRRHGPEAWWRAWRPRVVNGTYSGAVTCDGVLPEGLRPEGGGFPACRALAHHWRTAPAGDEDKRGLAVSFRTQFFPGVRLRWSGGATANLFNNGKYVLVGVRRRAQALEAHRRLRALMRTSWTSLGAASGCAWTAGS